MAFPEDDAPVNPGTDTGRSDTEDSYSACEWMAAPTKDPDKFEDKSRTRRTYASFGHHGTTASVNAHGHIMQISCFLDHGRSGFFCVDLPDTPEPYLVQRRMKGLTEISDNLNVGICLEVEGPSAPYWTTRARCQSLKFVHDRWPLYTLERSNNRAGGCAKDDYLSVEYFCNNGAVFQKYTWKQASPFPGLPQFKFSSDLLIRDLDFVDPNSNFNDKDWGYFREIVSSDRALVLLHQLQQYSDRAGDPSSGSQHPLPLIGLVMSPFAGGEPQTIRATTEDTIYEVILSEKAKKQYRECGTLEVTMAYRLEWIPSEDQRKSSTSAADRLQNTAAVVASGAKDPFQQVKFSTHHHLDFVLRRNLEHILSVCSVPLETCPTDAEASEPPSAKVPIALTCGDFSSHRVSPHASFFAFQFLLSIFEYINGKPTSKYLPDTSKEHCRCSSDEGHELCLTCDPLQRYLNHLKKRIQNTCQGHVLWVLEKAELTDEGHFAAHYWATGEVIPISDYLSPASLADSPLQILKVSDFDSLFHSSDGGRLLSTELLDGEGATQSMKTKVRHWVKALDAVNKRGKYAFAQEPENAGKFFLADHVWICRAISAVESLGLEEELERSNQTQAQNKDEESQILNEYCYKDLRKQVIKRFKTENPFSKLPMLATRRTSSESRFLFHSKDTALFHAMKSGFFLKEGGEMERQKPKGDGRQEVLRPDKALRYALDVWKNTVDAQSYHYDYQELDWTKPLWHALVLIIASMKQRVNTMPTYSVLDKTSGVLFRSSSPNGLFPGLLNEHQEPTLYEYDEDEPKLDTYWHTTFEIPYILWKYGKDYLDTQQTNSATSSKSPGPGKDPDNTDSSKDSGRIGKITTKAFPFVNFSNLIDQKGLVEVSDDWLQEGPAALGFAITLTQQDFAAFRAKSRYLRHFLKNSSNGPRIVLPSAVESCFHEARASLFSDTSGKKGVIIDIPRKTRQGPTRSVGKEINNIQVGNGEILSTLEKQRTVQDAKKRLIWLPKGDKETALLCYLASPDAEKDNMSSFFDRHANHEKFFFDETSAALNLWDTELHLSFFRRSKSRPDSVAEGMMLKRKGIPNVSFVKVRENNSRLAHGSYGDQETFFSRATISFRFTGDFFDRYWTCHFLEHDYKPRDSHIPSDPLTLAERLPKLDPEQSQSPLTGPQPKKLWQQRKVLELILFNEVLEEIYVNTQEILNWVRRKILPEDETMVSEGKDLGIEVVRLLEKGSIVDGSKPFNTLAEALQGAIQLLRQGRSENYSSIIERWRLFEQILKAMEDDLSRNLEIIHQWNHRAEDRKSQNPRWTRNDERRFGTAITKFTVLNQRKTRELESLKASIKDFRVSLTDRLASIRDDLSFRGSENINLFTYVTVVFLPLGFATAIFSMNGPPDRSTIVSMVELAFIAIALTIFALANAKTAGRVIVRPVVLLFRCMNTLAFQPIIKVIRVLANLFLGLGLDPTLDPMVILANRIKLPTIYFFYRYIINPLERLFKENIQDPLGKRWDSQRRKARLQQSFERHEQSRGYCSDPVEKAKRDYAKHREKVEEEEKKKNEEEEQEKKEKEEQEKKQNPGNMA